jgi:hypothetical protein
MRIEAVRAHPIHLPIPEYHLLSVGPRGPVAVQVCGRSSTLCWTRTSTYSPADASRCMLALVIYAVHLVRKSSISYITGRRDAT